MKSPIPPQPVSPGSDPRIQNSESGIIQEVGVDRIDPRSEQSWKWSHILKLGAVIFLVQVGMLCLVAERKDPVPRKAVRSTAYEFITAQPSTESYLSNLEYSDPMIFASVLPEGFSGNLWWGKPKWQYIPSEEVTPPPQTFPRMERLGSYYSERIASILKPVTPPMAPPGARLAEINDPPLSLVTGSVVWVEGEISQWPLILPGNLPSWPSAGVLSNNVVQVVVDDRGQVLSTVLLESSGLLAADNLALDLAGSARFQTPWSGTMVSSQEKWGKMVFSWQTTDPNPKVAAVPTKTTP